jgi:hypothetical protein
MASDDITITVTDIMDSMPGPAGPADDMEEDLMEGGGLLLTYDLLKTVIEYYNFLSIDKKKPYLAIFISRLTNKLIDNVNSKKTSRSERSSKKQSSPKNSKLIDGKKLYKDLRNKIAVYYKKFYNINNLLEKTLRIMYYQEQVSIFEYKSINDDYDRVYKSTSKLPSKFINENNKVDLFKLLPTENHEPFSKTVTNALHKLQKPISKSVQVNTTTLSHHNIPPLIPKQSHNHSRSNLKQTQLSLPLSRLSRIVTGGNKKSKETKDCD